MHGFAWWDNTIKAWRTYPPRRRKSQRRTARELRRVTRPRRWLNAYAVDLGYGGPEEGGWWYDVGEALQAIPLSTRHSATRQANREAAARSLLAARWGGVQHPRGRRSAAGGPDLAIWIEDHPAASFPDRAPHYE